MKYRKIEEYLELPYTIEVIHDAENGGWVGQVVELPGCLTQADTFEELGEMVRDAMRAWLETAIADGLPVPEPRPEEAYSGKFVVRVPRSLHRELVETAKREGVSLNQWVNVVLSKGVQTPSGMEKEETRNLLDLPGMSSKARRVLSGAGLEVKAE